jgi:hypothetical protein
VYIDDRRGNQFRIHINAVTGAARLEMKVGSIWEPRKEKWTWLY